MEIKFYQNLFAALIWIIYPGTLLFLPKVVEFLRFAHKNNIPTAEWTDIYIVLGSFVFQYFLALIVKRTCSRFLYENLEDKYQGDERLVRVDKVVKLVYDTIFYITSTVFAFYCFANTNIIPKLLFGSGECSALFDGYPVKPDVPYFNEFYLYQMGNHLYRLVSHWILSRNDVKFYEMHLHHWCAFWLIGYSYLMNFTHLGGITMILHDVGDIFLSGGRAYDSIRNKIKPIWYSLFILIATTWIYTRLIFFPVCIIKMCWDVMGRWPDVWAIVQYCYYFLFSLLLVLVLLHAYWISVFLLHGLSALTKKSITISTNAKRNKIIETMDKKAN